MYCSELGWWLWRADATESYMRGPRTGKSRKLKVQIFYYCSVYWNTLYTRRITNGRSIDIRDNIWIRSKNVPQRKRKKVNVNVKRDGDAVLRGGDAVLRRHAA